MVNFAPTAPYGGYFGRNFGTPFPQQTQYTPGYSVTPTFHAAPAPPPAAPPAPPAAPVLPQPPEPEAKLSMTPDRVEKLLEQAYARLDTLGNQLRAAASELEEIRAEILTANNLCDSELRSQLQQANDEIYKLRNQLSEYAERKVNKIDKKDLLNL